MDTVKLKVIHIRLDFGSEVCSGSLGLWAVFNIIISDEITKITCMCIEKIRGPRKKSRGLKGDGEG